jgi:hypothetical protein
MLQTYAINVSPISDIYCSKYFMLQVFHEHAWQEGAGEGGPLGGSGPRIRMESEADAQARSTKLYAWAWQQARSTKLRLWTSGEAEHEATSLGRQQVQSTRRSRARNYIHRRPEGIIIE